MLQHLLADNPAVKERLLQLPVEVPLLPGATPEYLLPRCVVGMGCAVARHYLITDVRMHLCVSKVVEVPLLPGAAPEYLLPRLVTGMGCAVAYKNVMCVLAHVHMHV